MPAAYTACWPKYTIKFRLLTYREVHQIQRSYSPGAERDLRVYVMALLDGPAIEQVPAGIMCWLGHFLVDQSPFGGNAEIIQTHVNLARQVFGSSFMEHARALLAGTFRYSFEELDSWDQEQFFQRLAAAEFLTGGPKFEAVAPKETATRPPVNLYEQEMLARKQRMQQKKDFLQQKVNARR